MQPTVSQKRGLCVHAHEYSRCVSPDRSLVTGMWMPCVGAVEYTLVQCLWCSSLHAAMPGLYKVLCLLFNFMFRKVTTQDVLVPYAGTSLCWWRQQRPIECRNKASCFCRKWTNAAAQQMHVFVTYWHGILLSTYLHVLFNVCFLTGFGLCK